MKRLIAVAFLALGAAGPALAQTSDPHAGHQMHMSMSMPMPGAPADPTEAEGPQSGPDAGAPPPIPADHDADRYFPPAAMADARHQLHQEHGGGSWSKVSIDKLELRSGGGADGYAWEGHASFGGDIDRLVVKSRGEGAGKVDQAEVDVLYSRAIAPNVNAEAGLRQDVEPHTRTHLALGFEGVAPYGFEFDNALFVSDHGDVTARLEATHDLRLTQHLILEPRAEANLSAQDVPALLIGAGLSSIELGLRLRYAISPEFAPYVGVNYQQRLGDTARLAHVAGEDRHDVRVVVGLRSWF